MSIDGINDFDECYSKKVTKIIDAVEMKFIGLEEHKKNKKATGRDKDIIDLKNLT